MSRIWLEKLLLTGFRSYTTAAIVCDPRPVVLLGANGAGKTNCLEAASLLTAGRGLRSTPFPDLARRDGSGGWAVSAKVSLGNTDLRIGTGLQPVNGVLAGARAARTVRIDEAPAKSSGALSIVRMLWLTPAMDGLFMGPSAERRRFIDRFTLSLDPAYARAASAFDRAMRQRNRALETGSSGQVLDAIEVQMAGAAVAVAAARRRAVDALAAEIERSHGIAGETGFPWAVLAIGGDLETRLVSDSLPSVEAQYLRGLRYNRDGDRAAGRTLSGPHRSDIQVSHGPKGMPAKLCSTGEQKALLLGLVLAQARLIKRLNAGLAPMLLLDEIAAHLDPERRAALFAAIIDLEAQVWMTGTDASTFEPLRAARTAQFFLVSNGGFTPLNDAES